MIEPIKVADLTTSSIAGSGVFDVLMKTMGVHLQAEFDKNRIRGPEYATVYLGSLDRTMQTALQFLLQKDQASLQAQLIEQQVLLAQVEVLKVNAQLALLNLQVEIAVVEKQLTLANVAKVNAEVLNIPKQGLVLDAQKLQIEAQTALTNQQLINTVTENTVLVAQECKLRAEFDLAMGQVLKSAQETTLLTQKVVTEKAQTMAIGVDADSVIGKQKLLYTAQTDGFMRDAEQKAAGILADAWKAQRMTDEGISANATNGLQDANIGRAMAKLLAGINA